MKHQTSLLIVSVTLACCGASAFGQSPPQRTTSDPPVITSSWDDLTAGIQNTPKKPRLDLRVHQSVIVDGKYTRQLISYAVESDERAHAYLGIPLDLKTKAPGIVALHGTFAKGKQRVAERLWNILQDVGV